MIIDWVFLALVAGSFVAAAFNAAFSIGGAMLILAITTTVLPVGAIVPLHSGLMIGSTLSRAWLFRPFMQGRIVLPFLLGSLFGSAIGTRVYVELPDNIIAIAIGSMMLVAIWLPEIAWRPKLRHPWVVVGFLHSLLSAMFAFGALLHSVVLHTGLERRQIIATMAGCLGGMSVFKIAGYAYFGFDYAPYVAIIVASVAVSFLGTAVGKHLSEKLPEAGFRLVYRVLVTVTALRLLYTALAGLVA